MSDEIDREAAQVDPRDPDAGEEVRELVDETPGSYDDLDEVSGDGDA